MSSVWMFACENQLVIIHIQNCLVYIVIATRFFCCIYIGEVTIDWACSMTWVARDTVSTWKSFGIRPRVRPRMTLEIDGTASVFCLIAVFRLLYKSMIGFGGPQNPWQLRKRRQINWTVGFGKNSGRQLGEARASIIQWCSPVIRLH